MVRRDRIVHCLNGLSGRTPARSVAELLGRAAETAYALLEAEHAFVFTGGTRTGLKVTVGPGTTTPDARPAEPRGGEFARRVMRDATATRIEDLATHPLAAAEFGTPDPSGPALFVPMRSRDRIHGYLAVSRRAGARRFSQEDVHALILLGAWVMTALENLRLSEGLEKLAVTDDLTQVYNYRFLRTALRREIRRAIRFNQEVAVIMVDVDNLKHYNDRHGHLRGSFLLKAIAGRLAGELRDFDLLAKYGGDEFTVILPQTSLEGAQSVAERLRRSVAEHTFSLAPAGTITISLGVAIFPNDGEDGIAVVRAADTALYLAKARGRNRVETHRREAA